MVFPTTTFKYLITSKNQKGGDPLGRHRREDEFEDYDSFSEDEVDLSGSGDEFTEYFDEEE